MSAFSIHTRLTMCDYLNHHASLSPGKDALVYKMERINYATLSLKVAACARALIASGVKQRDKVAVLSTTRPEYWVTFLATTSIGAIWLGLNPKYKLPEIRYVLEDAKPKLCLPWPALRVMTIQHPLIRFKVITILLSGLSHNRSLCLTLNPLRILWKRVSSVSDS